MKIGILTFHYSINVGSVLQAYCTFKLLSSRFPEANVEIINIVPLDRERAELSFIKLKNPLNIFRCFEKYRNIRAFISDYTKQSKRVYYNDMNKQIDYINQQRYDLVITGSDTVWMHSKKFNNELPTIYFLPELINAKKISLAATVDPLINEEAFINKRKILKSIFDKYTIITVRDNMTKEILEKIGIYDAIKIADPTLLFDFEKYLGLKMNKSRYNNIKTAMVHIPERAISEKIKTLLIDKFNVKIIDEKQLKIIGNRSFVIDYLNMYSDVDAIITDRYHRTIIGMKLSNALIINIERQEKNPNKISKGRELYDDLSLEKYFLRYENKNENKILSEIESICASYTNEKYEEREISLDRYIKINKDVWNKIIIN